MSIFRRHRTSESGNVRLSIEIRWVEFKIRRFFASLGLMGSTGFFLVLIATFLGVSTIPIATEQLRKKQAILASISRKPPEIRREESILDTLKPNLEVNSDLKALPMNIVDSFSSAGARIGDITFSSSPQRIDKSIIKTTIVASFYGKYSSIKNGLASCLSGHPSLALDSINLSRRLESNEDEVEAKLSFSYWNRAISTQR